MNLMKNKQHEYILKAFVESSIDDFNKHFDFMLQAFKKPLERTPEADVYVPRRNVTYANIEDSFGPSY